MSETRVEGTSAPSTESPSSQPTTPTETPVSSAPSAPVETPTSVLGDALPPKADPFDADAITLPDGFDRGEKFEPFADIMKEFGVSQRRAQELVRMHADAINAALKSQMDDWHRQQGDWQREIQADAELGGSNLDVVRQTVSKVLDNPELSDPKFREALIFTGAGNNPAVVRTLYRWASRLTEGSAIAGAPAARNRDGSINGERPSIASAIYGPDGPHSGGPRLS